MFERLRSKAIFATYLIVFVFLGAGFLMQPKNLTRVPSQATEALIYTFNEKSGECLNSLGERGRNKGWVQCGEVKDYQGHSLDLRSLDLRGLILINSHIPKSDLSRSDLRGAHFEKSDLSQTLFQNTHLEGSVFLIHPSNFEIESDAFEGSTIDDETRFPSHMKDALDVLQKEGRIKFQKAEVLSHQAEFVYSSKLDEKIVDYFDYAYLKLKKVETQLGVWSEDLLEILRSSDKQEVLTKYFKNRVHYISEVKTENNHANAVASNATKVFFMENYYSRHLDKINMGIAYYNSLVNFYNELIVANGPIPSPEIPEFEKQARQKLIINGEERPIRSMSSGLMQMDDHFLNFPRLQRSATLLHEARHSDCVIPNKEDYLKDYQEFRSLLASYLEDSQSFWKLAQDSKEQKNLISELTSYFNKHKQSSSRLIELEAKIREPLNQNTCQYQHVDCPMDHPDESVRGMRAACDALPWGAYWVAGSYLKGLSNCNDCSEADRQEALARSISSFNRVLTLDDYNQGKWPKAPTSYLESGDLMYE